MKRKKQIRKVMIIGIIWVVLLTGLVINRTYADSQGLIINIETDKASYEVGEDIAVTVELNQKVMSASYYLNYDSSKVEYKSKNLNEVDVENYPQDNQLRVVYFDINGVGTDEMTFIFTLKTNTDENISFNLSNTTMTTVSDSKAYDQNTITGVNTIKNITVKETTTPQTNNTVEDNNIVDNNVVTNTNTVEENNTVANNNTVVSNNTVANNNTTTNENTIKVISNKTLDDTQKKEENKQQVTNKKIETEKISNESKSTIPHAGTDNLFKELLFSFIVVTIYLGANIKKLSNIFKY